MLKAIGVMWPLLVVLVVLYTMVIVAASPEAARVWVSALPVLGGCVAAMAGVRFGGTPLKRTIANAQAEIQRKAQNGSG